MSKEFLIYLLFIDFLNKKLKGFFIIKDIKNKKRQEQDLNLRGRSPLDF